MIRYSVSAGGFISRPPGFYMRFFHNKEVKHIEISKKPWYNKLSYCKAAFRISDYKREQKHWRNPIILWRC